MEKFLTNMTEDVEFIQKLGDNPNADNGLSSDMLKKWFDKAPVAIKTFLNNTLIPEIEKKFGSLDEWITDADKRITSFSIGTGFLPLDGGLSMQGSINMDGFSVKNVGAPVDDGDAVPKSYVMTMAVTTGTLLASGWSNKSQTISVSGVLEDPNKQAIISVAAPTSLEAYLDSGVNMTAQGAGTLTFSCDAVPTSNLTVNILILTKGG